MRYKARRLRISPRFICGGRLLPNANRSIPREGKLSSSSLVALSPRVLPGVPITAQFVRPPDRTRWRHNVSAASFSLLRHGDYDDRRAARRRIGRVDATVYRRAERRVEQRRQAHQPQELGNDRLG